MNGAAQRCRPFLKWAGGKGRLLSQLEPLLPSRVASLRHVEPFAGGAAMFFGREQRPALLGDVNERLVRTYRAVRDDVEGVLAHLAELEVGHSDRHYYAVRERFNRSHLLCEAELAASFIYLNRTCFNGLYRENRRGEFNVPIGRYERPTIVDREQLCAVSVQLQAVELVAGDFEVALRNVGPGDFVYLDPPYQPVSKTSGFCGYSGGGFPWSEQLRLHNLFEELSERGIAVMLSNSDSSEIRKLYAGRQIDTVVAPRSINSRGSARGLVRELVVRNYV